MPVGKSGGVGLFAALKLRTNPRPISLQPRSKCSTSPATMALVARAQFPSFHFSSPWSLTNCKPSSTPLSKRRNKAGRLRSSQFSRHPAACTAEQERGCSYYPPPINVPTMLPWIGHARRQGDGTLHAPPVSQVGSPKVPLCPRGWIEWIKRIAVHAAMMHRATDHHCVSSHADYSVQPSCEITVF